MGKINGCLKCIFIFFNVLFLIVGCVFIYGAVSLTAMSIKMSSLGGPSVSWLWVMSIGILGISLLGIVAACSEKELALKIFAGFMGIGMLIMMIFGIIVAVQRNQIKSAFQSASSELAEPYMKEESFRELLEMLQPTLQCCGIASPNDWGSKIPDSCACSASNNGFGGYGSPKCKARPQGTTGPSQIYGQSCGELIFSMVDFVFQICMGILFGFAVLALLGLLISLFMIHQVKNNDTGGSIAMKSY